MLLSTVDICEDDKSVGVAIIKSKGHYIGRSYPQIGTMGKLKTLGVILSVALAVLAYCLYTPMPPEAEEPFQQMKFLAKFKSIMGFVSLLDMVGLDGMDTFRKLRSTKPVVDPSDTVTVHL